MKPDDSGNRCWWRLYLREVLPDEIDADPVELAPEESFSGSCPTCGQTYRPVEPAPDEGLVERLQSVIAEGIIDPGQHADDIARAVLAEIAKSRGVGTYAGEAVVKRVTELEAELATAQSRVGDWSSLNEAASKAQEERATARVRISNQDALLVNCRANRDNLGELAKKLNADLATVTRERDELEERRKHVESDTALICEQRGSLARELAEAKRVGDEATKNGWGAIHDRDRLARELAEAKATITQLESDLERDQQELVDAYRQVAEAREELRKLYAAIVRTGHGRANDHWCQIHDLLDAHRAKTSVAQAIPCQPSVADGERQGTAEEKRSNIGGKYAASRPLSVVELRVVRVEPEKAPTESFREPAPKLEEWRCPPAEPGIRAVHHVHDGGGERSGQAGAGRSVHWDDAVSRFSKLAELPADDGPPRAGDVVRWAKDDSERKVSHTAGSSGKAVWFEGGHGGWVPYDMVTVLRRAGQPEAKAEPCQCTTPDGVICAQEEGHGGRCTPNGGKAEEKPVKAADGGAPGSLYLYTPGERSGQPLGDNESLRRSGQLEAKAEPYQYPDNDKRPFTPIADAATVADLVRRVDLLFKHAAPFDHVELQDATEEIRAERAGRREP